MPSYRKKPPLIEAYLIEQDPGDTPRPQWFQDYVDAGDVVFQRDGILIRDPLDGCMFLVRWGNYLVRDGRPLGQGCPRDVFEALYELAD